MDIILNLNVNSWFIFIFQLLKEDFIELIFPVLFKKTHMYINIYMDRIKGQKVIPKF